MNIRIRAFLLFCLALAFYWHIGTENEFTIYQARDIHRAMALLKGSWIWYGSDLSGGGHTPGPFYYWLLALPLALAGTWQSVARLDVLMASAAAVAFWAFGTLYLSEFAGLLAYFFFLLSQASLANIQEFWNPSFLPMFQILILILLYDATIEKRRGHLIAGSLLLGLSIQIHYSQAIFLLGEILALASCGALTSKIKLKSVGVVLALVLIPMLPYWIWTLSGDHLAQVDHSPASGLSTLLMPIRAIARQPHSAWQWLSRGFGSYFDAILSREIPLVFVIMGWGATICLRRRPLGHKISRAIPGDRLLWTSFLISLPSFLFIGVGVFFARYVMPFFVALYLLSAPIVEELEADFSWLFTALTAALLLAVLSRWQEPLSLSRLTSFRSLVLLGSSIGVAWFAPFRGRRWISLIGLLALTVCLSEARLSRSFEDKSLEDRAEMATALAQATGWSYDFLRERLYLSGIDPEDDFSLFYEETLRNRAPGEAPGAEADGALVVHHHFARFLVPIKGALMPDWAAVGSLLPLEIRDAALSGQMSCAWVRTVGSFDICLYRQNQASHQSWNNSGYAYRYSQPALFPIDGSSGAIRTDSETIVFFLNACANREPSCTLYFKAHLNGRGSIELTALGDPIGVPDPGPNPAWAVSLRHITLEETCSGQVITFPLVEDLGFPLRGEGYPKPFLLAPYSRMLPALCDQPGLAVTVAEGTSIFNNFNFQPLHRIRLAWKQELGSRQPSNPW